MERKIFLVVLIVLMLIAGLFILTGCGNDTNSNGSNNGQNSTDLHKLEFVDMRYNEPKNYSKKEPIDMDGDKVLVFRFHEDDKKTINLYYNKNLNLTNDSEKYEEVTINGFKWKKFHDTDMGVYDTYEIIYNNGLYRIELNEVDKYKDEFDEFMKDVSFE